MTFIVFDQGYRTETPWYDLFPQKKIHATEASGALKPPSLELEQDNKGDTQPRQPQSSAQAYKPTGVTRRRIGCANDIMSQPVISVTETQTTLQVAQAFKQYGVHHMPVLNIEGALVGLISDRDLLGAQAANSKTSREPASLAIKGIMTHRVLTAQPHTGIPQLAEVMVKHRIGALPIVDTQGQLQGMVSRLDILRAIMTEAPIELWA